MSAHPWGSAPALLAALSLAGCGDASPPDAAPLSMAPLALPVVDVAAASSSSVGFSAVDITWRAGAKPGQVGTDADVVNTARLWAGIAQLATSAVRLQVREKPLHLNWMATEWTLKYLGERMDAIAPDRYVDVSLPGRGVHTPSHAKAIVVEQGGDKVALVRVDLYLMQRHIHERVAELVAEETGIPRDHILISATHNHSAADAAHTAAGISTLSETFDPRHFTWLTHRIAQAIIEADAAREPATMEAVRTTMRVAQRNVIGPGSAEVVPPEGGDAVTVQAGYPRTFFDDDLFVLDFKSDLDGERIASLFVFAMHPESLDGGHGMLSSDFVGQTEAGLSERWGAPTMWMPGGLGDVEQDNGDNFGTDYWREDFLTLEDQAATLVAAIGPVLEEDPLPTDTHLPTRGDLDVDAVAHLLPGPPNTDLPTETAYRWPVTRYLHEDIPLVCSRVLAESANIYLQAIRVGEVLFLGAPAEITTDLAKHIRSRINNIPDDAYQGYLYADNPAWVADRVAENFTPGEMSPELGFAMPVVISQSNDYMGYVVTRWEFENRHHYRQSMTLFGPDTADYLATRFEGLAGELRGLDPIPEIWDDVSLQDVDLEQEVFAFVKGADAVVSAFSRELPPQDHLEMGAPILGPERSELDEMGAPSMAFAWKGNTSDTGNPRVRIERQGSGGWATVLTDESPHLWLFYSEGGRWEAVWHLLDDAPAGTYRFRASGTYRGNVAGASAPDPLWDPEGKNASYGVISGTFTL